MSATRCPSRAALEHARSALGVRCAWYESRHYPYPPGLLEAHEEIRAILREADIQDWQDPAGNHDPGDEDDAAERAWTAEQIAAMRTLREAFSEILGAEFAKVGFKSTLLSTPVPP